jgi:hypothetical protein
MSQPTLKVTKDFTKDFNETIKRFKDDAVLIGIPADNTERNGDKEEPIGNAAILAINHFGSEEAHIPPRPVLIIGIRNAKEDIAAIFKEGMKTVLKKGVNGLSTMYERAGTVAANACKKVINTQDSIDPPADSTLRARKYLTASGFKGTKSLLVTGQVRNAITYVVRSVWGK